MGDRLQRRKKNAKTATDEVNAQGEGSGTGVKLNTVPKLALPPAPVMPKSVEPEAMRSLGFAPSLGPPINE